MNYQTMKYEIESDSDFGGPFFFKLLKDCSKIKRSLALSLF